MKFDVPDQFRKSLTVSWKEGIPANIMLVVMDYYLVPFALFLKATPQEIGLLVAFPHLLGSISQLVAVRIVTRVGSRLQFLIKSSTLQAILLMPVGFLAFLPFAGKVTILIVLASLFRILANLIGTAWGSLMSEYLEAGQRGQYLGWRSQVVGLAGILGLAAAGLMLYAAKHFSLSFGFFVLFTLVSICRFISARYFAQMTDLPYENKKESHFTFFEFIRRFRESNFVRYVLYVTAITFSTQLAAPYFSVYMLNHLHFDYVSYMSVHMASVLAGLISFPIWGRHADHVGNAKVMKTVSFFIPIIPLFWLFNQNVYYLIAIELFAGFIWGAFNLSTANYIFDAVSPGKRVRCLAYFNLLNGIAIFLGASLGGYLAGRLPAFFGHSSLMTLFFLSALLRFAAHFLLSKGFKEVRAEVSPLSSRALFFSVLGIRPMTGRNREWNIFPFK